MLRRRLPCLLFALLWSMAAPACDLPSYASLISADEHLAQARDVSVARVVRARPVGGGKLAFEFEVIRRVLGPERRSFTVIGETSRQRAEGPGPADHGDKPGMEELRQQLKPIRSGRLRIDPSCAIRPDFEVGKTYLAFLDQPLTHLSFEEVRVVDGKPASNDDWLDYVVARLRAAPR